MIKWLSYIISTAAKCSEVYGYGQDILPAINKSAASMTAAPVSIVAIRISCPGQSTKDICLTRFNFSGQSALRH